MFSLSYTAAAVLILSAALLVRLIVNRRGKWQLRRELALIPVYISLLVVARCTFFPFEKVNGAIAPLVFDAAQAFPPRINLVPFKNLLDYPEKRQILLNIIGNTTMFIPIGVIWPAVFRELNTHLRALAAGVGFSLCIELLQLPFFDRVTDVDDLILNSLGYLAGYLLYLLAKKVFPRKKPAA